MLKALKPLQYMESLATFVEDYIAGITANRSLTANLSCFKVVHDGAAQHHLLH